MTAPRRSDPRAADRPEKPSMPSWKAWLGIGVILGLGGLLMWWGLAIVVRCEYAQPARVDVTIERSLFGLVPLGRESIPDVVKADVYVVWGRTRSGDRQRRGTTIALELTTRAGSVTRRTQFGPAIGTRPGEMADQIQGLLKTPSSAPLTLWWMPWLVNVAALPFLLMGGAIVGEVVLRKLFVRPPSPGI